MIFWPNKLWKCSKCFTIIQLNEGDRVEVYAQSSIDGVLSTSEDGSHFEAARFPSPTE